jgi:hypothetical protein
MFRALCVLIPVFLVILFIDCVCVCVCVCVQTYLWAYLPPLLVFSVCIFMSFYLLFFALSHLSFNSYENDSDSTFDISEWSEAPNELDFGDEFAVSICSESDTNPDRDDYTRLPTRRKGTSTALPQGHPAPSAKV